MQRQSWLTNILAFLWECGGSGATIADIANELELSLSYTRNLLKDLINQHKIVRQKNQHNGSFQYFATHNSISLTSQVKSLTPLYDPLDNWIFDNNHCFLCGVELDDKNRTDEHIIPKWLQKSHNLWNDSLTLQNGTDILYRQLLIPCCSSCNSNFLGQLEKSISTAYNEGFESFRNLSPLLLYQWLCKIFYGLLFRELSLFHSRKDPSLGYIFSEEQLKEFSALHYFLQSVRLPFVFRGFQPWSIFIFRLLKLEDQISFDYRDAIGELIFSIRMGEIGVIACLEDAGVHQDVLNPLFQNLNKIALHPIQFDEFTAKITYSKYLMTRTPQYLITVPDNIRQSTEVVMPPLMGLSSLPMFGDWNKYTYASILHQCWTKYGIPFEHIYVDASVRTMFFDQDKNLLQLDKQGEIAKRISVSDPNSLF